MSVHNSALSNLHHGLQKVIRDKGWKDGLSDIQLKAIPIVMAGHDCIIEAPTAGGKTEAVFFPTLTRAALNVKRSVQVLYLAPLRALLNNVEGRAEEYAHACGLHAFKWHGDVEQEKKIKEFRAPSQLMLTTPESLEAILLRKAGWTRFFSGLEVVICDEAHNFASGDRGGHLLTLLERLKHALGKNFQRIALTATIGNPDEMLRWLAGSNEKPGKRIHVTSNNPVENDYTIHFFDQAMDEEVPPEIKSHIRELKVLYKLLPNRKSIVFGRSRAKTEALAAAIGKMNQLSNARVPVKVRTHHSSVSKFYREEAETLIKASSETGLQAIISTSTLELGIDIGALDLVIQAGSLVSPGAFLQRVGRTGRRAGKKKFFRGLCTERAELVLLSAVVNLGLKHISESLRFAKRAYHLLAHQLICLCLQNRGIEPAAAWNILSAAYCFSDISRTEFLELIDFMVQQEYFLFAKDRRHAFAVVVAGAGENAGRPAGLCGVEDAFGDAGDLGDPAVVGRVEGVDDDIDVFGGGGDGLRAKGVSFEDGAAASDSVGRAAPYEGADLPACVEKGLHCRAADAPVCANYQYFLFHLDPLAGAPCADEEIVGIHE